MDTGIIDGALSATVRGTEFISLRHGEWGFIVRFMALFVAWRNSATLAEGLWWFVSPWLLNARLAIAPSEDTCFEREQVFWKPAKFGFG
jgi:hypothetical protein